MAHRYTAINERSQAMNRTVFNVALGLVLLASSYSIICAEEATKPVDIASIFQERYDTWRMARAKWWKDHSSYSDRPQLPEDIALQEIGPSAINFWIAMFEEQLKVKTWDNGLLTETIDAFWLNTWKAFDKSDYPAGKYADQKITLQLYVDWWKEGRAKTPEKFDALFIEWDGYDRHGIKNKADKTVRKIFNMGVEIVPLVMEKIELGDTRLVPWVKGIMRTSVPWKTADLATVKDWWEKNKEKLKYPALEDTLINVVTPEKSTAQPTK